MVFEKMVFVAPDEFYRLAPKCIKNLETSKHKFN